MDAVDLVDAVDAVNAVDAVDAVDAGDAVDDVNVFTRFARFPSSRRNSRLHVFARFAPKSTHRYGHQCKGLSLKA